MTYPNGTLLTGHGRSFLVTGVNECREVFGPWATSFRKHFRLTGVFLLVGCLWLSPHMPDEPIATR